MFGMSQAQVLKICHTAFLSLLIVEKLVDGALSVLRFAVVFGKLII